MGLSGAADSSHVGRLQGKVAVLTGASRGIGAAQARQFEAEGAHVWITDVLDPEGRALAEELGEAVQYRHLDVSDEGNWERVIAEVMSTHGKVDVLVNNAAISVLAPLEEISLDDIELMWRINQRGVLLGMRAVAGHMRGAGRGSIINFSSGAGVRGQTGMVGYAATKFAVRGMTQVAAGELASDNVRVNTIIPGLIDTPGRDATPADERAKRPKVPLGRLGLASEVANMAVFLASDEASYVTGGDFVVDGGVIL